MNNLKWLITMKKLYSIILVLSTLASITTCKKESKTMVPGVETSSVDEIVYTSARVGGRVSDNEIGRAHV